MQGGTINQSNHSGGPHQLTPSPTKRQRISTNNDTTVDSTDNTDYNFDNDEEWETQPYHFLQVTFVGVFCASPSCRAHPLLNKRGSNLWIPTTRTILNHWKCNRCNVGNTPNGEETKRHLLSQQVLLHNQLKNSPNAAQEVEKLFPPTSPTTNMHFCCKCGFSAKTPALLKKHYGRTNKQCNAQIHKMFGPVVVGLYGFQIPSHLLEQIKLGQFTLPYNHGQPIGSNLLPPPSHCGICKCYHYRHGHQPTLEQLHIFSIFISNDKSNVTIRST